MSSKSPFAAAVRHERFMIEVEFAVMFWFELNPIYEGDVETAKARISVMKKIELECERPEWNVR